MPALVPATILATKARPYQVLLACADLPFKIVLAMLTRPYQVLPDLCWSHLCSEPDHEDQILTPSLKPDTGRPGKDPGKTLHFPSALHASCLAGCPPTSPPQLSHAAFAAPGEPCPCPPALYVPTGPPLLVPSSDTCTEHVFPFTSHTCF